MFAWGVTKCLLILPSCLFHGELISSSTRLFDRIKSEIDRVSSTSVADESLSPFETQSSLISSEDDVSRRPKDVWGSPTLNASMSFRLGKYGYVVVDHFIQDHAMIQALSSDVDTLRAKGRFRSARVGENLQLNSNIRVAEQCFLHNGRQNDVFPNEARQETLDRLSHLRDELSLLLESGHSLDPELDDLSYVYYPNGGFYVRHVDATPGTPTVLRKFSILLYLNTQNWTADMGGQLRLFPNNDTSVDVLPVGGRLVIFESDRIPHQVVETNQTRLVLVGWFCRAPSNEEIREFEKNGAPMTFESHESHWS